MSDRGVNGKRQPVRRASPPPVRLEYVEMYLDHAKVGCGWRRFLVLRAGRKHVRLLYPSTLVQFTIGRDEYVAAHPVPVADTTPRRLAERLAAIRHSHRRLELPYPKLTVRKAIAALRGQAA